MNPKNKRFVHWQGSIITGAEAIARYPDPVFFMRGRPSLTLDECREYLHRNADEAARVVDLMRGFKTCRQKGPIINAANKLHDFRVAAGIHGGEAGRPYLWEE